MVGITPPPHGAWVGNDGKPIYFDSIDNSAYILGKAKHSTCRSWVYINGENFGAVRADIGDDPDNPDVNIAWKYMFTAKDTWLGPTLNLGGIGALYNLTMDPYKKYDMIFNGAVVTRSTTTSPGRYAGMDNAWVLALVQPVVVSAGMLAPSAISTMLPRTKPFICFNYGAFWSTSAAVKMRRTAVPATAQT